MTGRLAMLFCLVWLWFLPARAGLVVDGPVEVVARSGQCAPPASFDAPARAFRDERGGIRLIAAHHLGRFLAGPDLDRLRLDCRVVLESARDPDPAQWDDLSWIGAVWTEDGRDVALIAHAENHLRGPETGCAGRGREGCWWNALTAWRSEGGRIRRSAPGAQAVILAPPGPYRRALRPTGYFHPSNIVADGVFRYLFVFGQNARDGPCLLRTTDPFDPRGWQVWDGEGFAVPARNGTGSCVPVEAPRSSITSVVRHDGAWLATIAARRRLADGRSVTGIWTMRSEDLVRFDAPQLLLEAPLLFDHGCDVAEVMAYPSLLDPASAGRNFDGFGQSGWLYLVRVGLSAGCKPTMRRELVRVRVVVRPG